MKIESDTPVTLKDVRDRYRRRDRGSVTLLFVILAAAFVTMAFMVVEGGQKLGNISRSQDLASEAARAAAASIDLDELALGEPRINQDDAVRRMTEILAFAGGTDVTWSYDFVDSRTVEVRVKVSGSSWIPGFNLEGNGLHRASAIDALQELGP